MSSDLKTISIKLFGLPAEKNGAVRADLFAYKLNQLVKGLRASDSAVHEKPTLQYLITDLKYGSAEAYLQEFEFHKNRPAKDSSVNLFLSTINAIHNHAPLPPAADITLVRAINNISKKVGKDFSHGEIGEASTSNVVRIDSYLAERSGEELRRFKLKEEPAPLFVGEAHGTFDGVLKEIDLRGQLASAKLILTAGGVEIDCICKPERVEQLKAALDHRVFVNARAIYGGKKGLPDRIEILDIDDTNSTADLSNWKGKFNLEYPSDEDVW